MEIFSRAILSKVDSGASIYEDCVTDFSTTQIVCRSDKSDDTDDSDEDLRKVTPQTKLNTILLR